MPLRVQAHHKGEKVKGLKQEEPPNGGSPLGRDKRGLSRLWIISSAPERERAWPPVRERAWPQVLLSGRGQAWQQASVPERARALRPEQVRAWPQEQVRV